jgi:hypothetical protein
MRATKPGGDEGPAGGRAGAAAGPRGDAASPGAAPRGPAARAGWGWAGGWAADRATVPGGTARRVGARPPAAVGPSGSPLGAEAAPDSAGCGVGRPVSARRATDRANVPAGPALPDITLPGVAAGASGVLALPAAACGPAGAAGILAAGPASGPAGCCRANRREAARRSGRSSATPAKLPRGAEAEDGSGGWTSSGARAISARGGLGG